MNPLFASQWRLVRLSVVVWTLLGFGFAWMQSATSVRTTMVPPLVSPAGVCLAAALGARLFASDVYRTETAYWSQLPISRLQWFGIKLCFGGAILIVVTILHALCAPSSIAFASSVEWSLLVYTVTIYLANSFERPLASVQAGLPAFFVSLALLTRIHTISEERVAATWACVVGVAAIAVVCAASLYRRRCSTGDGQRVLAPSKAADHLLHGLGQLIFVVLPLWDALASSTINSTNLSGWVGAPLPEARRMVWLAVGVLVLPWTLQEVRARWAETRWSSLALVMRTSGIGVPLWKAMRGPWVPVRCAACSRVRSVAVRNCPACSSTETAHATGKGWFAWFPRHPWSVAALIVLFAFGAQLTEPWWNKRLVHQWTLTTDLPQVLLDDGSGSGPTAKLECFVTTEVDAVSAGRISSVGSVSPMGDVEVTSPFVASDLIRARDQSFAAAGSKPVSFQDLPAAYTRPITLVSQETDARIRSWKSDYTGTPRSKSTSTVLKVHIPRLESVARELVPFVLSNQLSESQVRDAARLGEPFFTILIRAVGDAMPSRAFGNSMVPGGDSTERRAVATLARKALDAIIRASYALPADVDDARASQLLDFVHDRDRTPPLLESSIVGPILDLSYYYGPLRAFSMVASDELLRDKIESGDPFGALAAGLGKRTACYGALESKLHESARQLESMFVLEWTTGTPRFHVCCAWAMLMVDARRAANTIMVVTVDSRASWANPIPNLLGFSGVHELIESVEKATSTPSAHERPFDDEGARQRTGFGINAGRQPSEYWLGW